MKAYCKSYLHPQPQDFLEHISCIEPEFVTPQGDEKGSEEFAMIICLGR
jgi:hypothetical protein